MALPRSHGPVMEVLAPHGPLPKSKQDFELSVKDPQVLISSQITKQLLSLIAIII